MPGQTWLGIKGKCHCSGGGNCLHPCLSSSCEYIRVYVCREGGLAVAHRSSRAHNGKQQRDRESTPWSLLLTSKCQSIITEAWAL